MWLFGWASEYEQKKENLKRNIFFTQLYKYPYRYLIRKEVIAMAKCGKEIKKQTEKKKPQDKSGTKSSCGCGCIPPPVKSK